MAAAEGDGKREEKSKSKSRTPEMASFPPPPREGLVGALKKCDGYGSRSRSRVGLDGALTKGVEQALSSQAAGSSAAAVEAAIAGAVEAKSCWWWVGAGASVAVPV
jgi:hypothetical protein